MSVAFRDELSLWLESCGLSTYYDAFVAEGYDTLADVLDLEDEELKNDIGMKKGHIKRFKKAAVEKLGGSRSRSMTSGDGGDVLVIGKFAVDVAKAGKSSSGNSRIMMGTEAMLPANLNSVSLAA